ncbi:hypothetical protein HOY82DRAFT_272960 [Tuber indicum]|nr:hypothetical protein HOY82DRAFT_272960 [Tuber indicum]
MLIQKALLKYGYDKFKLEILEYCEESVVIKREQFYLDLLKPMYNILLTAGSSTGFKHTEETLNKIRGQNHPLFGKLHSEETKTKISKARKVFKHSEEALKKMIGKTPSSETKAKISEKLGHAVEVLDLVTNETITFTSINKAAQACGVTHQALSKRFKTTNSFVLKGRYQIKKKQ